MDAGKRAINEIFTQNKVLEIPYFQRSYVWDEPQWERFLNDMEMISSTKKPYFLGSVILKQQETSSNTIIGDVRTVIDGQQRLTTINIFFKVLGLRTNNKYISDTIFRLPLQHYELALKHNHNDVESFNYIMNLSQLEDVEVKKGDNITKAYMYFKKHIDPVKLDYNAILTYVRFVGIDVAIDEDEQQIFDTVNSLGVDLSCADLLKNFFFVRDYDAYVRYWENVFERDEDTKRFWDNIITTGRYKRTIIDLFFYAYLQIKIQASYNGKKVSTEEKNEFSRVENLFESYKKFIKTYVGEEKKYELLEDIKEYAKVFEDNFDVSSVEREMPSAPGIDRINVLIFGMDNSTLIPYVLYLLKKQTDASEKNKIFEYLETYIMRRIIVRATNKNYNQLFTDRCIQNKAITIDTLKDLFEKQTEEDTVNKMPSDAQIKESFENVVYVNKTAAGILYYIETKIRSYMHSTHLQGLNKYSLEHLMPKKWRNNWYMEDETREKAENRDKLLLTIGNLTIITQSLNASIRDADWVTKKTGKGNKGGLSAYASEIEITSNALSKENWTEQDIEERRDFLYEKAITIWKIS